MEPVGPEEQGGCRRELGPEHVAERHAPAAGLDGGYRLRGGQPTRPQAGHLAQRRRDRLDRAEIGTGPDHDRRAGSREPADGRREEAHRLRGEHRVRDVVAADQDHGDLRLDRERAVNLGLQVRRSRADDAELLEVDPPVGVPCDSAGEHRARRLLDPLHAIAGGARIAEQGDPDRGAGAAAAVPAARMGRYVVGLADDPPRELGLGQHHAVQPGSESRDSATAVQGGGGQLPRSSSFRHGPTLRTVPGPAAVAWSAQPVECVLSPLPLPG